MFTKNTLFRILVGIFVIIMFSSCQFFTEKISLNLNLTRGSSYNLRVTTEQKITQKVQGREQEINQTLSIGYAFDVLDVYNDQMASIKVTYHSVFFKQRGPMGVVEYDSYNPPAVIPQTARAYAAFLGESFTILASPYWQVVDIEGDEEMLTRVVKKLNLGASEAAMLEKALSEEFGKQGLKESLEDIMALYPQRPVGVGSYWRKRTIRSKGFDIILDDAYKLKSRRNGIAVIDVYSVIKSNPEAASLGKPILGGVSPMGNLVYDVSGEKKGIVRVHEETGWILYAKSTQRLSGTLRIEAAEKKSMGISWPISVEGVVIIEPFERYKRLEN